MSSQSVYCSNISKSYINQHIWRNLKIFESGEELATCCLRTVLKEKTFCWLGVTPATPSLFTLLASFRPKIYQYNGTPSLSITNEVEKRKVTWSPLHWSQPWWYGWWMGRGTGSCLGSLRRAEATLGIWWSAWCWWCAVDFYAVFLS